MADYDVAQAFQVIEDKLIKSMINNMGKHLQDEKAEGIEYTQWQAEQLKALEEYRKTLPEVLQGNFTEINREIEKAIEQAGRQGETEAEAKLLEAVKSGNLPQQEANGGIEGAFFKVNRKKLDSLIYATVRDFGKAETAVLRQANDIYRKTIFNAQVYLNSGAGTLRQAIDMATHDFLSAGLNCIQYRDGRRVNIASYAEMALRTANKRAYMQGEGTKCDEYGIHTKLISKHGGACPLCVRWQGRVVIDDVYSSGTAEESKKTGFPLLSQAIADGMFHPNCKNGLSLFIPGINAVPEQPTAEEIKLQTEQYDLEQKQRYNERQIRKYKRLADGSLDPENQKKYTEKLREWQKRQRDLIGQHPDKLRRQHDREQTENIFNTNLTSKPSSDNIKPYEIKRSREERKRIIKRGIEEAKPVFSYNMEDNTFPMYAQKTPHKEGFYDVIAHGAPTFVDFFGENIDAYTLAKIIRNRKDYIKGTKIRLLSCSTGNTEETGNCFAQLLSNELGVQVEAPTQILNVYPNGDFFVDDDSDMVSPKGYMKTFFPRR